jgi:hypothetical protein
MGRGAFKSWDEGFISALWARRCRRGFLEHYSSISMAGYSCPEFEYLLCTMDVETRRISGTYGVR